MCVRSAQSGNSGPKSLVSLSSVAPLQRSLIWILRALEVEANGIRCNGRIPGCWAEGRSSTRDRCTLFRWKPARRRVRSRFATDLHEPENSRLFLILDFFSRLDSRRKREREALREFNGTLKSPRAGVRGRARTRERQVHARGCKCTARVRHGGHGGRSGGGRSGHDGRSGGGRSGHDGRSGGGGEEASSSSSSSTAIPAMSSTGTSRSTVQRVAASMRVFDEFRNSTPRALEG